MAGETRERIEEALCGAGLRLTPQRFAIIEFLMGSSGHPTADQVGAAVNRRFPRASRATIYNTLHSLCEAGLVREVFLHEATARYDVNLDRHHHFICRICGGLEDVPARAREMSRAELEPGYRVESWELILRGVCPRCSGAASGASTRCGSTRRASTRRADAPRANAPRSKKESAK